MVIAEGEAKLTLCLGFPCSLSLLLYGAMRRYKATGLLKQPMVPVLRVFKDTPVGQLDCANGHRLHDPCACIVLAQVVPAKRFAIEKPQNT